MEATVQVQPYLFTNAVVQLAEERGASVILGSAQKINYTTFHVPDTFDGEVIKIIPNSERVADLQDDISIALSNGDCTTGTRVESVTYIEKSTGQTLTIPATTVVLAAGPWTPSLLPQAPVSAIRAHSITVKPQRELSAYCLFTQIHRSEGNGIESREDNDESKPRSNSAIDESSPYNGNKPGDVADATAAGGRQQIVTPEIYARPNKELYVCGQGDTDVPLPPLSEDVEISAHACQTLADAVACVLANDVQPSVTITSRRACYPGWDGREVEAMLKSQEELNGWMRLNARLVKRD